MAFGYPYGNWGEDIAAGYADAQDTLNQWITACDADSSGNCTYAHRQIMLNPVYVVFGIARAYSATSTYGWYWVADFGGTLDATLNLGSGSTSDTQPPSAPVITSATREERDRSRFDMVSQFGQRGSHGLSDYSERSHSDLGFRLDAFLRRYQRRRKHDLYVFN